MARESRLYNYLDEYREDRFAQRYNLEPILFNENNVATVEILQEVEGWDQSRIDSYAGNTGSIRYHKYLVKCPRHDEFFQLIEDEPRPWSYRCYHCVTDEIDRVVSSRFLRDRTYLRASREVRT